MRLERIVPEPVGLGLPRRVADQVPFEHPRVEQILPAVQEGEVALPSRT